MGPYRSRSIASFVILGFIIRAQYGRSSHDRTYLPPLGWSAARSSAVAGWETSSISAAISSAVMQTGALTGFSEPGMSIGSDILENGL